MMRCKWCIHKVSMAMASSHRREGKSRETASPETKAALAAAIVTAGEPNN